MNPFLKNLLVAAASSAVLVAQGQAVKQSAKRKDVGCSPCAARAYVEKLRAQGRR
jgi:hypothetical protein